MSDLEFIGAVTEVLVVQPNYEGEGAEDSLRAFWARVDADPTSVVVVVVGDSLGGVFSSYANAMDFAASRGVTSIVAPYRLDDPSWGNTVVQ